MERFPPSGRPYSGDGTADPDRERDGRRRGRRGVHVPTVLEEGQWFITYPDEFTGDATWQAKIIREWNSEANSRFMVARTDGRIVGAVSISGGNKERVKHVGMIEVYVERAVRGRGVGRALMDAAIVWAESNPILHKLALHVFEDNVRAVKLYEELGFVTEGRLVGEFQEVDGSLRNDLLMARAV